jgi:nucleoid-associated protein YgaU
VEDKIVRDYSNFDSKNQNSRYNRKKVLVQEDGTEFLESFDKLNLKESGSDKFHLVLAGEKNRLDIISYKYYGTPLLYWIIAEVNNLNNPTLVEPGTVLRIPSTTSVYRNGVGVL